MAKLFDIRTLYPSETWENVMTAIFQLFALRAFEFIFKSLILSSGRNRLSTAAYALDCAADEAFNPVNYFMWYSGCPDFPPDSNPHSDSPDSAASSSPKRRIPLNRATLAIALAALVLIAEALFFYSTQQKTRLLPLKHLRLSVHHSNKSLSDERIIRPNACAPLDIEAGRATLRGTFAFCNWQSGSAPFVSGSAIRQIITQTEFSLKVNLSVPGVPGAWSASRTAFSLLIATPRRETLVVRLHGRPQENTTRVIERIYSRQRCSVPPNADLANVLLTGCGGELRPEEVLQAFLDHIEVRTYGNVYDIGWALDGVIQRPKQDLQVGQIEQQRVTAVGMLCITVAFVGVSIAVFFLVPNDGAQVLGALLRRETGQDARVPTVALEDHTLQASAPEFDEESKMWKDTITKT